MMSQFCTLISLGLVLSVHVMAANAEKLIAQSGKTRVQLVEVFSSESCSSCPPADEWASGLQMRDQLWKSFVPVVFHVDYWNQLGWVDALSSKTMTQRLMDIAQHWPQPRVYTPAVVIDGQEWTGWSSNASWPISVQDSSIELVIHQEKDGSYRVDAQGLKAGRHYQLRMAQLGMGLSTQVTGGENSGRKLKHDFVVLNWESHLIDQKTKGEKFVLKKAAQKALRQALIAWIEEDGTPTPLQAVGNFL